jgi:eukaryotic-like serine/threonine-protein kinase
MNPQKQDSDERASPSDDNANMIKTFSTSPGLDGESEPRSNGDSLNTIALPPVSLHASAIANESRTIGPYTLITPLGTGGMGEVWLAEQSIPVKRRVALKLIKAEIGSNEIAARFDAERQALAMMNHPNIASILDVGTTDDGQPYLVMELVQGLPLTTFCDQNRMVLNERLRLFVDVCSGVQHAHQKGIIHRDLKPGNLLVGIQDGKPVPKIIDFGLAKATESAQRLTDKSVSTSIGQVLGTLKYMSPEQASLDAIDIDTRTDIYALGVILYELLTGGTPLDDSSIQGHAVLKVLEFIRDKEPAKPSSRLGSTSREHLTVITGQRQIDSIQLNRILTGDLDWIVMKALEKDRTRRYESVSGFAADIRRFLNNEPVIARPPSFNYRVRKFVRKHRVAVSAASMLGLGLFTALVGTGLSLARALNAEQAAVIAQGLAEGESKAKEQALREREAALAAETLQRQYAESVAEFVEKDFLALTSVEGQFDLGPERLENKLDKDTTLRELLDRAAEKLEIRKDLAPLIEARLRSVIGESYRHNGDGHKAVLFLEKAFELRRSQLGPDNLDTLKSMNQLASGYQTAGQLEKALPLFERSMELIKAKLGSEHIDTMTSMNNLAGGYQAAGQMDKALPLYEQSLETARTKLGPEHQATLGFMNNLAFGHQAASHPEKALPLFSQTLDLMKTKLGLDHDSTLKSMHNLAICYRDAGQLDEATSLLEQTLARRLAVYGREHPSTLATMNGLAGAYRADRKLDKALPLYEQTLELTKNKFGLDHPRTLTSMNNLAFGLTDANHLDKATALFEKTLELTKTKFGPDHSDTLNSMANLAANYLTAGQLDKALPLLEETLELQKTKSGINHATTLVIMNNLGKGYQADGQLDKAIAIFEKTLELKQAKFPPEHVSTLTSLNNLAVAYQDAGEFEKARPLLEKLLPIIRKVLGPLHPNTITTVANLGATYKEVGRFDEAISLLEEAFESSGQIPKLAWVRNELLDAYANGKQPEQFTALAIKSRRELGPESIELAEALIAIGEGYLQLGSPNLAFEFLQENLSLRQNLEPDRWKTFHSQSLLGGALLAQAKDTFEKTKKETLLTEAESLLRSSHQGMNARAQFIPTSVRRKVLTAAVDRLIECYELLDQPANAKMYRVIGEDMLKSDGKG